MSFITSSRLKCARLCMRKHHLMYIEGWRPSATSEALRFGTLIHAGLEAWWKCVDPQQRLHNALTAMANAADPFEYAKATALLAGYDARWGGERLTVVAVEREFRAALRGPDGRVSRVVTLAGKIDAIVQDENGRTMLVEHKTSAEDLSTGGDYWRRLIMDSQVSIYFDGADAIGLPIDGCIYDVIGKPALRPYTATPVESRKFKKDGTLYANQRDSDETPAEYQARIIEAMEENPGAYFCRHEVVRLPDEIEAARKDTWDQVTLMQLAESTEMAPRNSDACRSFGSMCPFFDVCAGVERLENNPRFTHSENVHPELTG